MNRRDALKIFGTSAALPFVPLSQRAFGGIRHRDDRPRYFVFVFISGGLDAIYGPDPKTRADVAPGVDVPYKPDQISTFGKQSVGPFLKVLGDWNQELSIVKGVHTGVLNHISGGVQFLRLKLGSDRRMPSIMSILGAERDSQAVPNLSVGFTSLDDFSPDFHGSSSFGSFYRMLEASPPEDLRRLAKSYRRHAKRLGGRGAPATQKQTAENLLTSARLFERVVDVPKLEKESWGTRAKKEDRESRGAEVPPMEETSFQRILWILENDLACSVLTGSYGWDTHQYNDRDQTTHASRLFPALARFIDELHRRRNRFGTLADNTVLFIGSELGRFPRLNQFSGKDHFPDVTYMLMGKSLKNGAFGATGKQMEGLPVSLRTGSPGPNAHKPSVNDMAVTLLSLAGIAPGAYGYSGKLLSFLLP